MKSSNLPKIFLLVGLFAVIFGGAFWFAMHKTNGGEMTEDKALAKMNKFFQKIDVETLGPASNYEGAGKTDPYDALPPIAQYPLGVTGKAAVVAEIVSSTEKATANETDHWLLDMAEAFNKSGVKVGGKSAAVSIRAVASGLARDYIAYGKDRGDSYKPEGFTPANALWGENLIAEGIALEPIAPRLVGNTAGIVLSKKAAAAFTAAYGDITVAHVTEAVTKGDLVFGYTNPFASSAGANFLLSALGGLDSANPLSESAAAAFEQFSGNIPYVAYTTLQMKESALSGSLEGFVFESQQFQNTAAFGADYVFTPFGVRHDSPLYALPGIDPDKAEVLRLFAEFCKQPENQDKATAFGFNQHDDYASAPIRGEHLADAQKLWKQKKTGGRPIVAVFVADTSGSMQGAPIQNLRNSLLAGAKFIGENCIVGLVTFSDRVSIALPVAPFDTKQQTLFNGAVKDMQAGGNTAMYDAIVVGEKLLSDSKADFPNAKRMLFVLTDGETNKGLHFAQCKGMIGGLSVPIYTIGYNAETNGLSLDDLKALSAINEAACINATTDDVAYTLQSLFNAEM